MSYSNQQSLQLFLGRLISRSVLNAKEQDAILSLPGHAVHVKANEDFIQLGKKVDHVCLIVDGLVGRFDQNSNGARQITAIHIAGDMVDLHSVVQPQATSAFQALSGATILRISHSAVRAATAQHPSLAEALWRDCMVDSSILAQWVVNVGRRDGRSRVAHLLCEMAARLGAAIGNSAFTFPFLVTQAQLADATGLTNIHINRLLKVLREDGIADVRKHEVCIFDWDSLIETGDFDPTYLQMNIRPEERLRIVQ